MSSKRLEAKWDTSTLDAMEKTAKDCDADGSANKRFEKNGVWLEVIWERDIFRYKWGKNFITRESAAELFRLYSK